MKFALCPALSLLSASPPAPNSAAKSRQQLLWNEQLQNSIIPLDLISFRMNTYAKTGAGFGVCTCLPWQAYEPRKEEEFVPACRAEARLPTSRQALAKEGPAAGGFTNPCQKNWYTPQEFPEVGKALCPSTLARRLPRSSLATRHSSLATSLPPFGYNIHRSQRGFLDPFLRLS